MGRGGKEIWKEERRRAGGMGEGENVGWRGWKKERKLGKGEGRSDNSEDMGRRRLHENGGMTVKIVMYIIH